MWWSARNGDQPGDSVIFNTVLVQITTGSGADSIIEQATDDHVDWSWRGYLTLTAAETGSVINLGGGADTLTPTATAC